VIESEISSVVFHLLQAQRIAGQANSITRDVHAINPGIQTMKRIPRTILVTGSLFCGFTPLSAQTKPVDWGALARESQTILADYLRINTTNPPGNEFLAARFLKGILDREGIEAQILDTIELGPNRANLYARLRGNGVKRAIALVHHMDVVPATPSSWSVDPFSGAIKDGYIWGRGAIDMKGMGVAELMAMIAIKRSGVPLTRDIVYIGNSDEELTSTGGLVFVSRHPDLLKDVEYLVTEGADNRVENGKVVYFAVGVAEKRTFWQRLTVNGVPSPEARTAIFPPQHSPNAPQFLTEGQCFFASAAVWSRTCVFWGMLA